MKRWAGRIVLYAVVLLVLTVGALAAAYAVGIRLPIYSDVAAFALQNWNKTGKVDVEADYDASLVRQDGRIHVTVDLALPDTVQHLRDFLDGGKAMLVDCRQQDVFLHGMQNGALSVADPVIGISGRLDLELEGVINLREGRHVDAAVRVGHDRTNVWVAMERLAVEGLPDPLIEPLIRDLARMSYTREDVLDMAAAGLSPELAGLLARNRDALDLAFEDIVPGQIGDALTVDAVFSVDEGAALGMVGDSFADAGGELTRALAAVLVSRAEAQGLGRIGDILEDLGGQEAREAIEGVLEGDGLEDVAARIAGFSDCATGF